MTAVLPQYQADIAKLIGNAPGFRGRVLDVDCGGGVPLCLASAVGKVGQLDGVDPCDAVLTHPGLAQRWKGEFETSSVPTAAYDAAYSYNVVEHVSDSAAFLQALARVLKPGGVFWAATATGYFPFGTRWIARWHDSAIGRRFPARRLVVAYRLQRGE